MIASSRGPSSSASSHRNGVLRALVNLLVTTPTQTHDIIEDGRKSMSTGYVHRASKEGNESAVNGTEL
jgi:hypothetical protein